MYDKNESRSGVYAIVRSGGRQHKVAVGDIVEIDKVADEVGSSIEHLLRSIQRRWCVT